MSTFSTRTRLSSLLNSHCPLMVVIMYCIHISSNAHFEFCVGVFNWAASDLPPDLDVWAGEVVAEGESVVAGVLEYHRPNGNPHILRRHGSASPGAPAHELRPGDLLRQHHLLVHSSPGDLWCEQVPGSLCDDDWQNGEKKGFSSLTCSSLWHDFYSSQGF